MNKIISLYLTGCGCQYVDSLFPYAYTPLKIPSRVWKQSSSAVFRVCSDDGRLLQAVRILTWKFHRFIFAPRSRSSSNAAALPPSPSTSTLVPTYQTPPLAPPVLFISHHHSLAKTGANPLSTASRLLAVKSAMNFYGTGSSTVQPNSILKLPTYVSVPVWPGPRLWAMVPPAEICEAGGGDELQ